MNRGNCKANSLLLGVFVLLLVAPACLGDLMCYVCDDCKRVTKETPLLACNGDFFNQGGSTEASTVTTTTSSTVVTTDEPAMSTDSTMPSEVTTEATASTTELPATTTESATTETTELPIPTPATAGPPETTTGVPTPPVELSVQQLENVTRLFPASDGLNIRQRRDLIETAVSYHCYSVDRTVNGTVYTDRGCSRVEPQQSVCKELTVQNVGLQLSNCDPCSMSACNAASGGLHAPLLATVMIATVAALLQLK